MAFNIQCPGCQRKLSVPDTMLNKRVKCPSCAEVFQASETPDAEKPQKAKPPLTESIEPAPERPAKLPAPKVVKDEADAETDYAYEEEPKKKSGPGRRQSRDDEDEPRPARRRRDDDDDDDEDDYAPRRRSRVPHRGGLILTLGIISLVVWCCPLAGWIVGGIVLNMANKDLAEMAARRMDDSGHGLTMAGKICGIIAVVLSTLNAIAGFILRMTNKF
jgi:hypothetical protein